MIINGISTSLRGLFMTYQEVGEATPKTKYVNIPYGNGSIDLTEALGGVTYNDRIVKADFVIKNYDEDKYSSLKNELHGLKTTISVKDGYHFIGRVRVLPFYRQGTAGRFSIEATCEPYMYKDDETVVIVSLNGTQEVILTNEKMTTIPTIFTDAPIQVIHGANTYSINAGTHRLPIVLEQGDTAIQLSGTANVSIMYQEGAL